MKLNFIVPCYNEEETVDIIYKNIKEVMKKELPEVPYSLLLVDDGSRDKTMEKIRKLAKKDKNVQYISFSRNFGKEAAMLAGLRNVGEGYVSILDADMQDPPALIPQMYKILQEGEYDCVCTKRATRDGEPKIRSIFARMFYALMNKISMIRMESGSRDFLMMTGQVRDSIVSVGEYVRFFKGLFVWVGFKRKWLEYDNINRVAGETKWNFWSLTKYALVAVSSFTVQPLIWPFFLGAVIGLIGLGALFADFTIALILMLSAVQLCCMGVFGYYIATMFLETKRRPNYLIKETNIEK